MSQRATAEIVRSYCDAWRRGDTTSVLALYHPDLTLDWPGRHRLAGAHDGQAASIDALLELQRITNRTPVDVLDTLVGEHSVVVLVRERWASDPHDPAAESIELLRALDFTVADGQLRTCRVLEADQPGVDDWIERYGAVVSEA